MTQILKSISDLLTVNIRQVLFAFMPLTFFIYASAAYAINNQPEEFSNFGLVISLWSLFSLSLHRQKYNNVISNLEQRIGKNYREEAEAKQRYKDEALSLTFDLHSRVRIHNQNMTTAAKAHADRKTFGHLS